MNAMPREDGRLFQALVSPSVLWQVPQMGGSVRRQIGLPDGDLGYLARHEVDEPVTPLGISGASVQASTGPGPGDHDNGGSRPDTFRGFGDPPTTDVPQDTGATPPGTGSLVRPYTKTGGRTRSEYDLAIETLISTKEGGFALDADAPPEHTLICSLCRQTRSVAEIAAHLRLPLGVAKVLIGDLAGMGRVVIHQNDMVAGARPSVEFMERVLSGLRRL